MQNYDAACYKGCYYKTGTSQKAKRYILDNVQCNNFLKYFRRHGIPSTWYIRYNHEGRQGYGGQHDAGVRPIAPVLFFPWSGDIAEPIYAVVVCLVQAGDACYNDDWTEGWVANLNDVYLEDGTPLQDYITQGVPWVVPRW